MPTPATQERMLNQVRPINKSFCLQVLCEDNYKKLFRLIPKPQCAASFNGAIHCEILASGPYTHTVRLHQQHIDASTEITAFKCRIYHDTHAVEVINIEGNSPLSELQKTTPKDILNNKWALNYFFEKWLTFQLQLLSTDHNIAQSMSA